MSFVLLVVHKISAYCISGGTFIIYYQWVKSVLVPGWMDGWMDGRAVHSSDSRPL